MRTDLIEQRKSALRACKLDLADCRSSAGEELGSRALEVVQGEELEELVEKGQGVGIERGLCGFVLEGFVEVLHDLVLSVGSGQTPKVNQQAVPGLLLFISVLESLERQERHAPGERVDKVLVTVENVKGSADILSSDKLLEDDRDAVVGSLSSEDCAGGLEEVSGDLLGEHVVIALPCNGGKVVGVPAANAREGRVAVTTTSATANFKTLSSSGGSKSLESAGDGVQVCQVIAARVELLRSRTALGAVCVSCITTLSHALLVCVVEVDHGAACEVQSIR
jgi:hypothetical protein